MVPRILHILIVIHFVLLLFLPTNCDRKSKSRGMRKSPNYHIHESTRLPSDVQITTFLKKGEIKSFVYDSQIENGGLSLTITPCTSPIKWSVKYPDSNSSQEKFKINETSTRFLKVFKGFYMFNLEALENASFLHIYLSTEEGGPQALRHNSGDHDALRLLKRQKRRRLTVKWNPSLVDPQVTDYCLVVSRKRHYDSLCSAQSDCRINFDDISRNGPPVAQSQTVVAYEEIISDTNSDSQRDPFVACVGKSTHYTISSLQQGQTYYFDLFAINGQSNFTYRFASSDLIFDGRTKPISLKDGKSSFANLKKLDGKAVFRYKVGRKSDKSLDIFVVPCGGAVDVEITTSRDKVVVTHVEGFKNISIPNPGISSRYYIKIFALNKEELKKTTGVEVYATTKSSSRIPLPSMPQNVKIKEYFPLTTCDSITVGWLAPPVQKSLRYCVVVKEGKIRELDDYRMPNQCGLENRLKKSADILVKYCIDFKDDTEQVLLREVSHLKPGRSYIVQVTAKKPKGKTLSYDLLQVYTKPSCHKNL